MLFLAAVYLVSISDNFLVIILFMLGLVLLKVVASSSTNGAGGVGGIFAPTLFIGGINGYLVASLLKRFVNIDLPDNRFVLCWNGRNDGRSDACAPYSHISLIAEITGGYNLLIPLIITSTVAYITTRSFEKHSIYHVQLAERGELVTHDKDKAALVRMDWRKEIEKDLLKVKSNDTLGDLVKLIAHSGEIFFR